MPETQYTDEAEHIVNTFGARGLDQPAGSQASKRLIAMLEMGQSRPWPDALEALTGQQQMDATAIRDYFAPLRKGLGEQNCGKPAGW